MAIYEKESIMKKNIKPKALLVPFGHPEYSPEILNNFVDQSVNMLKKIDIEVEKTDMVMDICDCEKVNKNIKKRDYDFLIALLGSWIEAPNFTSVLRDYFNESLILWSHTSFIQDGVINIIGPLPAAGVIRETLEEMDVNFKFVVGQPDDKKIIPEFISFSKAAKARKPLSKSRVGLFGYISLGMYTASFDHFKLKSLLGVEVDQLDQYVIIKEMDSFNKADVAPILNGLRQNLKIGKDIQDELLEKAVRMYLSIRKISGYRKWDALTIKCQYDLSKVYGFAPCVPLSIFADEFTCSCEGDTYNVVTQLILHFLTGKIVSYGEIWHLFEDGFITGHCGFAPLSFSRDKSPEIIKHTSLYEGIGNASEYKNGRASLVRLANKKDSFKIHLTVGKFIKSPEFRELGAAKYSYGRFVMDGSIDHFIQSMASQHYAIVYEDITKEIIEFGKLFNFEVIIS